MPHLLGIDVGTSGTKSLLLAPDGTVAATATVAHSLQTPRPGWTEQSPDEWWDATQKSVAACLKKAGLVADDVAAIGFSGQMHGSVFLDGSGKVLRPALLWNDQRTATQSQEVLDRAGGPGRMIEMVGNLPLTGYTVPKILWFRENEPELWAKCGSVILPKDYVRYKMTGDLATDVGDASGTALLDISRRDWSGELLKLLDLDPGLLPKLHESPEVTGTLHAEGAKALGLKVGTPVVAGAGDVMSGAIGNGVVEAGLVNANVGTGGVMCAHSDVPAIDRGTADQPAGRIATMCHAVPGAYVLFGCMLSAAGSLQWYADEVAAGAQAEARATGRDVFEILMAEAETVPAGCEGLFFLPYLTGERCPHPDPKARGGWIGATRRTTTATLVRSLIEGVTFNMNAMLRIMTGPMGLPLTQVRATGGGAKSTLWRQIQADCYDAPLALTNSEEGGAFGAALLAGVGAGTFPSVPQACRDLIRATSVTPPDPRRAALYAAHQAVYDKLYGDLKDRFAEIDALPSA